MTDEVQIGYEDLARRISENDAGGEFPRYSGGYFALTEMLRFPPGEWIDPLIQPSGNSTAQLARRRGDLVEREECGKRSNGTTIFQYRLTPAGREIAEQLQDEPS